MKTLILALVCTIFTTGTIMAQSKVPHNMPVADTEATAKFKNALVTDVMLSEEDAEFVASVRHRFDQKKDIISEDKTLTRSERNKLLSELCENYKTQVINRTSEEKYKKIEKIKPF